MKIDSIASEILVHSMGKKLGEIQTLLRKHNKADDEKM